ncbi:MAG: hypothetical protein CVU39_07500 [Chloroflexi bacterium HGW-Chloroflexi-10]|nr:MAG: hypothetical protein CVU39_07500 [Chloroflexi bacterium HGW-Chloroflexi-10]
MKFNWFPSHQRRARANTLTVLVASAQPRQDVIAFLAQQDDLRVKEAFTTRGVLQELPGVHLIICDTVLPATDTSPEILARALEMSGIPQVSPDDFFTNPGEWLGRARLTSDRRITFLPMHQVNILNWAGGVGKSTLAMAICKRFVERTGLPAALLELSMAGSMLHARISTELPEFYAIATHKAEARLWNGVSLYPMDGRTFEVLWSEDAHGVRQVVADIRKNHTLLVVDAYPGHPLFPDLTQAAPNVVNLVVTTPREDAVYQARRLMENIKPAHLVLNMTRSLAERAENGVSVILPYKEGWAQALDARLADPLLELVYLGWKKRHA